MEITIRPGRATSGLGLVPGDKSIAHRWLLLGALARGTTRIVGLPASDDVRSTASALASLMANLRPQLDGWARDPRAGVDGTGFTSHNPRPRPLEIVLDGRGRTAIAAPGGAIDCGNSGTTMRLLAGVLAPCLGTYRLEGDASLSHRPMERVAAPLRVLGADIETVDGHAPLTVRGGGLVGADVDTGVPSAQVKGAVLLAGLAASGRTVVREPVPTRDHTERALSTLGCHVGAVGGGLEIEAGEPAPFEGTVPGDVSGALFLLVAAAASGGSVRIEGVGLNPTRTALLGALRRMGVRVEASVEATEVGEPVGTLDAATEGPLRGLSVTAEESPALVDEIPALASLAALADGESRFVGVGELRLKESDRLAGIVGAIRAAGGEAAVEGDDLVVAGGGLRGGVVDPLGDHRLAMAFVAAGAGATGPITVRDGSVASVSFPGFAAALRNLGLDVEG